MPKFKWETLLPAAAAAGFLGWAIYGASGCELIAAVDRTKINQTSAGGAGGTGGTAGGGGVGNQGGGGNGCVDEDCPGTTEDCRAPGCVGDECGFINAAAREMCDDGASAEADICDGNGNCVECIDENDCDGEDLCSSSGVCIPASCTDGVLNNGETGLDDGAGNECGGPCAPCVETEGCEVATDCLSFVCDTSGAGGGGGSGPAGVCVECAANGECPTDRWCNTGADPSRCAADKAPGAGNTCAADAECVGNANCRDGYCCDTNCGSTCQFCGLAGTLGVCTTVPAGQDPGNDCTAAVVGDGSCNSGNCSGTGTTCAPMPNTHVCDQLNAGDSAVCDVVDTCNGTSLTCIDTFQPAGTLCAEALGTPNQPDCNPSDRCNASGVCIDGAPAAIGLPCDDNGGDECDGNDPGICVMGGGGAGGGTGGAGGN